MAQRLENADPLGAVDVRRPRLRQAPPQDPPFSGGTVSRIRVRAMIGPVAAAAPWTKRAATSRASDGAEIAANEATR